MELDRLRELIQIFEESGVSEMDVEVDGMRVSLKKSSMNSVSVVHNPAPSNPTSVPQHVIEPSATPQAELDTLSPGTHAINSPMLGTFYRSPSPEADPFVSVGDIVEPETTVCIVEAMKLMNEIKAETGGRISRVLVENGQPIEYGQPLFALEAL